MDLARRVVFITGPKAREHLSKVSNLRIEKPFNVANVKKIVAELTVSESWSTPETPSSSPYSAASEPRVSCSELRVYSFTRTH